MKLQYNLDVAEGSWSISNTPGQSAQRLPFHVTAWGNYLANHSYFTEREGLENSFLLLYTIAGKGLLTYKDCKCELTQEMAVVINCAEYHYYKSSQESPWHFKWVHFSGMAAMEYCTVINGDALGTVQLKAV